MKIAKPYLISGGISFLIYSAITLHIVINSIVTTNPVPYFEIIIQAVAYLIGIVSIILLMFQIRSLFSEKRKNTNVSIIMLSIFLVIIIAVMLLPELESLIGAIIFISLMLVYSFLRMTAFLMTNNTLKIPSPEYGSRDLVVYSWSFPLTTFIAFIFTLVGVLAGRPELVVLAFVLVSIQNFIDVYCILALGVAFICHAVCNPKIEHTIYSQPTPLSN